MSEDIARLRSARKQITLVSVETDDRWIENLMSVIDSLLQEALKYLEEVEE